MKESLSLEDIRQIESGISRRFARAATRPEGIFRYPTGVAGLEGQGYAGELLEALPREVLAFYCGVGNPFSLGPVKKGEFVLDIGCGAGVDTMIAALMAGPEGEAVGIDLTSAMVGRARENLKKTRLENVFFQEGSAEDLQFGDSRFDAVISNGAYNLVVDKARALREAYRVLKPNGRFMIADQVLRGQAPEDRAAMIGSWAG